MHSTPKVESHKMSASEFIESKGWRRDVAGEDDFALASKVVEIAKTEGKGILLMGSVGVGKTHLAQIVFNALGGPKSRIECSDSAMVDFLVPECDAANNGGSWSSGVEALMDATVFLDDLGAEQIIKSYGNELDRVGNFIVKYHARGKRRLIVTTNLDGDGIVAKYGARVFDRLVDICAIAKFTGKSKRNRMVVKL